MRKKEAALMFDDCIIMAGGSGTRLWPASSSRLPKQFLPGPGGKSFFLQAVERGLAVTAGGRVIIIAGKGHAAHVVAACAPLTEAEKARIILIVEPRARNTAPAIACGTVFAEFPDVPAGPAGAERGGRKILVLTSDHVIEPLADFQVAAQSAGEALGGRSGGNLVVFGIAPSRPETGYGYIEAAEALQSGGAAVYRAASFREKPDHATAERFLAAGNFYWNSGMFAFSSRFMREEFSRNAPDILAPFEALAAPGEGAPRGGIGVLENWPGLAEAYDAARAESIDYAIAEKCPSVVMVAGTFRWLDVGSWDEYARLMAPAPAGGLPPVYAVPVAADSCFVDADIPVALCGVEDLVVVIRTGKDGGPAVALVAKKGETQQVRDLVAQIKAAGRTDLL
jgi:mannose-1-phosphate guanylyltransferase/mannose-1-phosphate guanylyltransferase/mannose-6-phosphate isomerase